MDSIDVIDALNGTPRPHYLVGKALCESDGNSHSLDGKVNFASDGNPSILDRVKLYLPVPHVNIGDACFALWNAAHILGNRAGYGKRILKGRVEIDISNTPVPPDTLLDLYALVIEERKIVRGNRELIDGPVSGRLILDGKTLIKIRATYSAERYIKGI